MYFYFLYGYGINTVLENSIKFTEEEFSKMCNKTPIHKNNDDYYIKNYLIENYGFKELEYDASFSVDDY